MKQEPWIAPPEPLYSDDDIRRAREQIAQEKWDALDSDAQEWLEDCASERIVELVRGTPGAMWRLEKDCVGALAYWVSGDAAVARLDAAPSDDDSGIR